MSELTGTGRVVRGSRGDETPRTRRAFDRRSVGLGRLAMTRDTRDDRAATARGSADSRGTALRPRRAGQNFRGYL